MQCSDAVEEDAFLVFYGIKFANMSHDVAQKQLLGVQYCKVLEASVLYRTKSGVQENSIFYSVAVQTVSRNVAIKNEKRVFFMTSWISGRFDVP